MHSLRVLVHACVTCFCSELSRLLFQRQAFTSMLAQSGVVQSLVRLLSDPHRAVRLRALAILIEWGGIAPVTTRGASITSCLRALIADMDARGQDKDVDSCTLVDDVLNALLALSCFPSVARWWSSYAAKDSVLLLARRTLFFLESPPPAAAQSSLLLLLSVLRLTRWRPAGTATAQAGPGINSLPAEEDVRLSQACSKHLASISKEVTSNTSASASEAMLMHFLMSTQPRSANPDAAEPNSVLLSPYGAKWLQLRGKSAGEAADAPLVAFLEHVADLLRSEALSFVALPVLMESRVPEHLALCLSHGALSVRLATCGMLQAMMSHRHYDVCFRGSQLWSSILRELGSPDVDPALQSRLDGLFRVPLMHATCGRPMELLPTLDICLMQTMHLSIAEAFQTMRMRVRCMKSVNAQSPSQLWAGQAAFAADSATPSSASPAGGWCPGVRWLSADLSALHRGPLPYFSLFVNVWLEQLQSEMHIYFGWSHIIAVELPAMLRQWRQLLVERQNRATAQASRANKDSAGAGEDAAPASVESGSTPEFAGDPSVEWDVDCSLATASLLLGVIYSSFKFASPELSRALSALFQHTDALHTMQALLAHDDQRREVICKNIRDVILMYKQTDK
jgi:hypothetical protein